MQAIISSRHFKLFQEFKEEIFEALNEFDREAWSINKVEAILNRTHGSFQVELLVSGRSLHIESKSESSDLMGAFYKACERTSKQINKIMDKRNNHRALHLADIDILAEELLSDRNWEIPA